MADAASFRFRASVALFALSGVSGLVYQVAWVRQFGRVFGNTVHSAALVTGVFMCGLGVGSWLAGRWIDARAERPALPITAYGVAELAIAALAVALTFVVPSLADLSASASSYVRDSRGWYELSTAAYLLRYALAVATLAPPTLLMGATLTLLVRSAVGRDLAAVGWRVGVLYGVNTLGAAVGAIATDYALVPSLGITATQLAAAVLSAAVGVGALALARRVARSADEPAAAPSTQEASNAPAAGRSRALGLVAISLAISGFAAMGLEIAWFRFLTQVLGGLRAIFSLLLAVILVGIWVGSMLGGWLHRRYGKAAAILCVTQGLLALSALGALGLFDHAARHRAALEAVRVAFVAASPAGRLWIDLGVELRATALVVLVPAILMGLSFPLANACVQDTERAVGARAGVLYLANTAGNVLGSAVVGFVLLPGIGIQRTALWLAIAAIANAVPMWWAARSAVDPHDRTSVDGSLAVGVGLAVVAAFGFTQLPDDALLRPSVPPDEGGTVTALRVREGLSETIVVTEVKGYERRLFTNGHSMSGTRPKAQRYMRAFAHLPLLQLAAPERVLVICFGVGSTLDAASRHPSVRTLELADLSREILEQAPMFAGSNRDVLDDPRVSVFVDDGRHHLRTAAPGSYDLVTLEPPPIVHAGVSALYSREFYRLVRERLAPNGYLTQWLPAYQASGPVVRSMVRAFVDVFPESVLLSGDDAELILMGTKGPSIQMDLGAVVRRAAERPDVARDLEAIGMASPLEIAGTFAGSAATMVAATRDAQPLTDDHPMLEYGMHSANRVTRIPDDLFEVAAIGAWCPRCLAEVPGLAVRLKLLGMFYASDAFLASGSMRGGPDIPTFVVPQDPAILSAITASAYLSRLFGGGDALAARLAGEASLEAGALDAAVGALTRAAVLRPDDPIAHEKLGIALDRSGAAALGAVELERAVTLAPDRATARFAFAAVLRHLSEGDGALEQFRAGLALDPFDPDAHLDYAAVLQQSGQAQAAEVEFETTLDLDPMHGRANLVLCKRAAARKDLDEARRRCELADLASTPIPPELSRALAGP